MTGIGEIINMIWNLPWYKVLVIAAVDDAIILIKLWPVWLGLLALAIIAAVVTKKP